MSRTRRELLPRLGRSCRLALALSIAGSLAVGCATGGARSADERGDRATDRATDRADDPHARCDAELARATATHQAERERLEQEARGARDDAALAARERERMQAQVLASRERADAQGQALEAALASIRKKEEELAALRAGATGDEVAGAESAVAAATSLLRQKDAHIRRLQDELARLKNPDLPASAPAGGDASAGDGGVTLASMDLEVPVATIDGAPITRRDFVEFLYRDLGTPALLELAINRQLISREARRRGVVVSDVDCAVWVEEQLVDHIQQAGSKDAFLQKIAESGFDEAAWTARLRFQARPTLVLRRLVELERTTPEGREAFEARVREEYTRSHSERVRAGHIFVEVARGAGPDEVAAAERKAQLASEQVRRGVPFADVARRISEDPQTRHLGGTLGTFDRSRFARTPELNTAFFTLPVGEVSTPIRTHAGFHVVLVDERTPPTRPFDEAMRRELIGRLSKEPPADAEMEALVARLRARAHVTRTLTFD